MTTRAKALTVVAAYAGALAVAAAVVGIHVALTLGPDRDLYGVMYDFGDIVLFVTAFAAAAIPATALMLLFLRRHRRLWQALSIAAIVVAATGVMAFADYLLRGTNAVLMEWSALAVLRILAAPALALLFLTTAFVAPNRSTRIVFFATTATEAAGFASVLMQWLSPT
ncbi:MAG TPA: hypothetical protein VG323_04160 [Thermoanaerobaculia bacterium]|nr:hypothetical protein [Thermoanaerobaculia bacterium]